jgi:transcriptional regulator with XRE-family HTH domain
MNVNKDEQRLMLKMGNNMASARRFKKLSQVEAAGSLGISVQAIRNYEQGKRQTPANVIRSMVELYGCSPDYLLALTNNFESHN